MNLARFHALAASLAALLSLATAPALAESGTAARKTLLDEVNVFRGEHERGRVATSPALSRAAQRWAEEIAESGRVRHGSLREHLRRWNHAGEVIEWHSGGARPIVTVQKWRESPPHRQVLLYRRYDRIGMGFARGRIDGRLYTIWVARLAGD